MAAPGFFLGGLAMVELGICHWGQEIFILFFYMYNFHIIYIIQ